MAFLAASIVAAARNLDDALRIVTEWHGEIYHLVGNAYPAFDSRKAEAHGNFPVEVWPVAGTAADKALQAVFGWDS